MFNATTFTVALKRVWTSLWECHAVVDGKHPLDRLTLTDDERLAIQWIVGDSLSVDGINIQATLRGLLERTNYPAVPDSSGDAR